MREGEGQRWVESEAGREMQRHREGEREMKADKGVSGEK